MRISAFSFLSTLVLISGCTGKINKIDTSQANIVYAHPPIANNAETKAAAITGTLQSTVLKNNLFRYPDLTVELSVKDTVKATKLVQAAGGKVIYDPNLGFGSQIPFLVVTLPPTKVIDGDFMAALGIQAAKVRVKGQEFKPTPIKKTQVGPGGSRSLSVPIADIHIPDLRAKKAGEGLGSNVTVAVIDTGSDVTNPALAGSVVYWADHTQQTRTLLIPASVQDGQVSINADIQAALPVGLDPASPIFTALFDEQAMAVQLDETGRDAPQVGLDINRNGTLDDTFPVIVGKEKASGLWVAYVGTTSGTFSPKDLHTPIADFNDINAVRACQNTTVSDRQTLVQFPARNRELGFPLLIERQNNIPVSVSLGMDLIDHGTHVSGIIAGHGAGVEGAAPKVNIMTLKVCSGWSCTDDAILRGLVDAFYNPYGCMPDVVNISLGSPLGDSFSPQDMLLRDLASKFGATFFIAAGNDGPGYRSISDLGASGPAVIVAAQVSKNTFQRLYNANSSVNLPDNMLLYFSSLGPTFTGLMRPSIAAPGTALSSIPLADGGLEMMNGTSMATPIAAGGTAAMLSLAKLSPDYQPYAQLKAKKIAQLRKVQDGTEDAISLQQFPLNVRAALQESAHRMPQYTDAEQGFGVIDVAAAYDLFLKKLKTVNQTIFGEYAINDNDGSKAIYSRAANVPAQADVALSLIPDTEAAEADMLALSGGDLQVNLDYVDAQDNIGGTQRLTGAIPFAIMSAGVSQQVGTSATVVPANSESNTFRIIRKLSQMDVGKTYSAHFSLKRNGQEVQSLIDVVHRPFTLADNTATFNNLSGISVVPITKTAAFVKKAQVIKASEFHHYPIAVTERDQGFSLSVGISQGVSGVLFISVYDPDGQKVLLDTKGTTADGEAVREPGNMSPVSSMYIPTKGKAGIYEVTVANDNTGLWIGDSKYDLMVVADRLRVSKEKISLASGAAKSDLQHSSQLTIMNSSRQGTDLAAELDSVSQMERISDVQIEPQSWTFRQLHMPVAASANANGVSSTGITTSTGISVNFGPLLTKSQAFSGRIDNHLYVLSDDGVSFTPVYSSDSPASAQASSKEFKGVALDGRQLYVALETYEFDPAARENAVGDLDVYYEDVVPNGASDMKVTLQKDASTKDVFVLKVAAPPKLDVPVATDSAVPVLHGNVLVQIKGAENPQPYSIQFTISQ